MFKKRNFFKIIYTNSDLVAFDMYKFNQILIPISED